MYAPGKWRCTHDGCDYGKSSEAARREREQRENRRAIARLPEDRRIVTPDEFRRELAIAKGRRR